jgi:ParB-like chromosome segregation protein Spo0J
MITWVDPYQCRPPHRVSHPEKVAKLAAAFYTDGWGAGFPALVGYPHYGKIQLLSGSHRWVAAQRAQLRRIPVVIYPLELVSDSWGDLPLWAELMRPVLVLKTVY